MEWETRGDAKTTTASTHCVSRGRRECGDMSALCWSGQRRSELIWWFSPNASSDSHAPSLAATGTRVGCTGREREREREREGWREKETEPGRFFPLLFSLSSPSRSPGVTRLRLSVTGTSDYFCKNGELCQNISLPHTISLSLSLSVSLSPRVSLTHTHLNFHLEWAWAHTHTHALAHMNIDSCTNMQCTRLAHTRTHTHNSEARTHDYTHKHTPTHTHTHTTQNLK